MAIGRAYHVGVSHFALIALLVIAAAGCTTTETKTVTVVVTATAAPSPIVGGPIDHLERTRETPLAAPTEAPAPPTEAPPPTVAPQRIAEDPPTIVAESRGCPSGCTAPPEGCNIKGNINAEGEKIYHVPGGGSYGPTVISPDKGERWFCTDAEAVANGWRKARN